MRTINPAGTALIKEFEGFRSSPYQDQAGVWTIGYGSTYYLDNTRVDENDSPIDEPTAAQLLEDTINKVLAPELDKLITPKCTGNQFSACVAFCFNIGIGNFRQSTVLNCMNHYNWQDAADALLLWNKVKIGGILTVDPGLMRRRQAERALFLQS